MVIDTHMGLAQPTGISPGEDKGAGVSHYMALKGAKEWRNLVQNRDCLLCSHLRDIEETTNTKEYVSPL